LVAVAVGVYVIVESTVVNGHATVKRNATSSLVENRRGHHRSPKPKFYVVKSGDTLSAVAARTGVPLSRLTSLNPSVSAPPYNLQTGQRLRLRR
jgi:LysM repeat protein